MDLTEWLANGYPPWAVYQAITSCRLVALDKCPCVRLIGIGDIMRRLVCKILLIVAGKEATRACGTYQLCSGLEAGIEGGIYHARSMWDTHVEDDQPWGILMIDVRNAFNEGNQKMMVWIARHVWPSGVYFLFNTYRHHAVLILRGGNTKESVFTFSREGIVQGCSLATTGYGLLVLPLIRKLKVEFTSVKSP